MPNYTNIRHIYFFSATLFLLMIFASCLYEQTPDEAFRTVTVGFNALTNTNRNTFHGFWKPETGYEGYIRIPVHFGSVQYGMQYTSYSARTGGQPGDESVKPGWILKKNEFDIDPGQLSETEFSAGIHSRLRFEVYTNYSIK